LIGGAAMKLTNSKGATLRLVLALGVLAAAPLLSLRLAGQKSAVKTASLPASVGAKAFNTPQQAADALIEAAANFDVHKLQDIFGWGGSAIVLSGEYPQDRQRASDCAAQAGEKQTVSLDPKRKNRAFLLVGTEEWPFPVPLVKVNEKWFFDAQAGRQELLNRRIGSNALDAI